MSQDAFHDFLQGGGFGSGIGSEDLQTHPQKVNILLVDDSAEWLMGLEGVLAGPDRYVIMVQSGEEALRYLLEADVGVILLDVRLTGLSGYETAALIRKRPRLRNVPIIFLTAHSKDEADIAKGYSFGAVDYIFKPVSPDILKSKVDCFVELAKWTQLMKRQAALLKRAETQALQAAAVIKDSPVPAFVVDLQGTVLQVNAVAAELLGLQSRQSVSLSPPSGVLTDGERWLLAGTIREVLERGVTRQITVHPRREVGEAAALSIHVAPLRATEDHVVGALGLGHDVSAHEKALVDTERLHTDLEAKQRETERLREIVLARDLALYGLEKDKMELKQQLRRLREAAGLSETSDPSLEPES